MTYLTADRITGRCETPPKRVIEHEAKQQLDYMHALCRSLADATAVISTGGHGEGGPPKYRPAA